KSTVFVMMILALVLLSGQDVAMAQKKVKLTFTSGGVGGEWYVMSAGVADLIREKAPWIEMTVLPGGGTLNNVRVGTGEVESGWGLNPFVVSSLKGEDPYKEKYPDIRVLGGSFGDTYLHLMVAEDKGITSIDKIVEKKYPMKIGVGRAGVSGEWAFRRFMEKFYKVTYADIKAWGGTVSLTGYPEIATNLKDRHLDFGFINIAPPAAVIQEAALGRKLLLLPFTKEQLEFMKREMGLSIGVIKKEVYPGVLKEDIPTAFMGTVFMVHKNVDPDVAYEITKILYENASRLPAIAKCMADFKPEIAWKDMPAELHPGAVRYYKEKGYLK
ncbi:MAG: TAXI family TRAP transporter solute-binding subunit, partial [Pseudomonadota bacterium]